MPEREAQRTALERETGGASVQRRPTPLEPASELLALHRLVGNQAFAGSLSRGVPLDAATRVEMEAGFGHDLENVRLHRDTAAARAVQAAGARAYTVGRHIFLGQEAQRKGPTGARHLLAHELAHVVQQERGGTQDPAIARAGHEERADRAADAVLSGRTHVDVGPGTRVGVARSPLGTSQAGVGGLIDAITEALGGRLLGAVGLPPGAGLALSAVRGFVAELARQLFKDDTSAAALFLKRVSSMTAGDFGQFSKGYLSGLVEGVISPVTDLVGLAAFGEHLQKLRDQFLLSVFAGRREFVEHLEQLVTKVKKLFPDWRLAWANAKADPKGTVLAVLGMGEQLRAGADAMAYNLGKSGAQSLTASLIEPFTPKQEPAEAPEPSLLGKLLQPATTAVAAGRALMDRIQNTPWAKVGGKFGYVVGSLAIQLVMLVFTEGLGNLIEQVAQKIGSLGAALSKLLRPVGTAVTRMAEFLAEIGRGIAVVEELMAKIIAKAFKPLEKILGPVLVPFSEALHELRAFLRKLLGVAEKDGVQLVESATGAATKAMPHPDIAPTPKPAPHTPAAPKPAPAPPAHPYREPTPPVPEDPHFPVPEEPGKPPTPAPAEPGHVPEPPTTPEPVVHPPTRRRIDPSPFKEPPATPRRRGPDFEIDPRFRKPVAQPRKPEAPPPSPVPPEPVRTPPGTSKPPEPLPKPPEPLPKPPEPLPKPPDALPKPAASAAEPVLAPEPPVAVPARAEASEPVPEPTRTPALVTAGAESEAGSVAAPVAESGGRPPVRASAEGGGGPGGVSRMTPKPDGAAGDGGHLPGPSPVSHVWPPQAEVISDRVTALEKLRVPNDVRRPLVESLQRIREAAATDPAAADRLLDELEHVLESRGILLPGQTLDKPTKDVLGGGRVADDEVRAAAEEIDALTKVSTSYIDRFTWQLSEEEAVLLQAEFPDLPARGWLQKPRLIKQQGETVIIKRGRTPERTTIPERYHPGTPSHPPVSLEVKNWPLDDVAMAENRFARSDFLLNTADQAKRRAAQLPANAEQYILIDVRGQHVDVRTQDSLARALEQMSDGALRADRVRFLTGGGTE